MNAPGRSHRLSQTLLVSAVCVWLAVARMAVADGPDVRVTASPLRIHLRGAAVENPLSMIPFREPFHVRIENVSDRPVSICDPREPGGLHQLSFRFRHAVTGRTWHARWRKMSHYALREWSGPDSVNEVHRIDIPPGENHDVPVDFDETLGEDRLWIELPDPVPDDRFHLVAEWESAEEKGFKGAPTPAAPSAGGWRGRVASKPALVGFEIPKFGTPHEALVHGFPAVAIQTLEADPTWLKRPAPKDCRLLHEAAQCGSADAVRWILDHGGDVNALADGLSALHYARDPDIVALILARKPDLELRRESVTETALQFAAREFLREKEPHRRLRWRAILDLYFEAGAEYDLITAILLDDLPRVRTILAKTPALAEEIQDKTPFRIAAGEGRLEICRYLLDNFRIDVDDFERGLGYPVILEGLRHPAIVRLLIGRGADLKTRITSRGGRSGIWIIGDDATLLHYAAGSDVPETVRVLLDQGLDVFARTGSVAGAEDGETPLEIAAIEGDPENTRILLDSTGFKGAPEEQRTEVLDRALWCALSRRWSSMTARVELVKLLLDGGADARLKRDDVTTVQILTQEMQPDDERENRAVVEMTRMLVDRGAEFDLPTAVAIGDEEEVRRLLARDPALANARNSAGRPALHVAIVMNRGTIVDALLKAGCDVTLRDTDNEREDPGQTALECAELWERTEIARRLQAASAGPAPVGGREGSR